MVIIRNLADARMIADKLRREKMQRESAGTAEAIPALSPKRACGTERGAQPARETNCVSLVSVVLQDDQPLPDLSMAEVRWLPPVIGDDVASVTPLMTDKALGASSENRCPDRQGGDGITVGATAGGDRQDGIAGTE